MLTRRELIRGAGSGIALAGLSTGVLAQIMAPRMLEHGYRVGRAMGGLENRCRLWLGIPAEMERFAGTLLMFRQNGWV